MGQYIWRMDGHTIVETTKQNSEEVSIAMGGKHVFTSSSKFELGVFRAALVKVIKGDLGIIENVERRDK